MGDSLDYRLSRTTECGRFTVTITPSPWAEPFVPAVDVAASFKALHDILTDAATIALQIGVRVLERDNARARTALAAGTDEGEPS